MYTEQDIKSWFSYMIQKYRNSPISDTLKTTQITMFDDEVDNLNYFIHYIKEENK